MVGRRKDEAPEPREEEQSVTPVNEPGEKTDVVHDPDEDPQGAALPKDKDYTGPGTHVPRSERLDWPEGSVCYLGEYSIRELTAEDFKTSGVEDQPTTRWDASNQYAIPQSAFSEAALRLVQQTGEFKLT